MNASTCCRSDGGRSSTYSARDRRSLRQHPAPTTGPPVWIGLDARTGRSAPVTRRTSTKARPSMKWKSRQLSVTRVRPVTMAAARDERIGGLRRVVVALESLEEIVRQVNDWVGLPDDLDAIDEREPLRTEVGVAGVRQFSTDGVAHREVAASDVRLECMAEVVGANDCRRVEQNSVISQRAEAESPPASWPRGTLGRSCGSHQHGCSSRGAPVPSQRSEPRPQQAPTREPLGLRIRPDGSLRSPRRRCATEEAPGVRDETRTALERGRQCR